MSHNHQRCTGLNDHQRPHLCVSTDMTITKMLMTAMTITIFSLPFVYIFFISATSLSFHLPRYFGIYRLIIYPYFHLRFSLLDSLFAILSSLFASNPSFVSGPGPSLVLFDP